ncbi:MAG: hypothetical protein OXB98_07920 [Bryobacterales bacterium]|nr:hypothetical protein [Bryobacterales bacterium]
MITAQDAVDALYRIAVKEAKATSTARLDVLADFCVQELTRRGLTDVEKEAPIPGAGREKKWDIAWRYDGKYRLGVSLKSLLKNLGGTVPNRIDDMIGEVTNAQLHSPEIVIGYIMIFNIAEDYFSQKHGSTWCELFRERATALSGRRPPSWTTGTVEDFVLVEVDFNSDSSILETSQTFDVFFGTLVEQVRTRNPNAISDQAGREHEAQ